MILVTAVALTAAGAPANLTTAGVVILVSAGSDPIKIGHERALSAVLAGAIRALVVLIMPWVPTGRASPKLL